MLKRYIILILIPATFLALAGGWYFLNARSFPFLFVSSPKIYKIGILQFTSELDDTVYGFQSKLKELGYAEGKSIALIYRNSEGDLARLKRDAKFFTDEERVDLIYALTTPATAVAKEAAEQSKTPVVFGPVTDPVKSGLVKSVESSGNNLTGIMSVGYPREKAELLLEQKPGIKTIGVIYRKGDKSSGPEVERLRTILDEKHIILKEKEVTSPIEIPDAAESLAKEVDALYGPNDGMISSAVDFLIGAANSNRIPLVTPTDGGISRGGLLYYGPHYFAMGETAAEMTDKILRGASPSSIPIQPTPKFWLAVNLDTAEKINQPIAPSILQRADYIYKTGQ